MSIGRTMLLKNLHLYGMASAWSEWQAEYALQQKPVMPEVWLDRLIEAEPVDRQARSLSYQLEAARFPIHRDLMQFEWHETPLQQARIEQLATAGFMEQAYDLILVAQEPAKSIWQQLWRSQRFTKENGCVSITPR